MKYKVSAKEGNEIKSYYFTEEELINFVSIAVIHNKDISSFSVERQDKCMVINKNDKHCKVESELWY